MLGTEPFRIVFASGVVRFDAHGNLFVNLPHTDESPQRVSVGSPSGPTVAAPERRARVHGSGGAGVVSGSFIGSADLPRGLTVEVKDYESARFADGALVVELAAGATIPDWWQAGEDHHFGASDEPLRLWVKSSVPDGATLEGEGDPGGSSAQPKPVARAQFQPKSEKASPPPATEAPAANPASSSKATPSSAASGQPYRPGRLPAGHLKPADKAKSGLGCSTLMLLVVIALGATAALV